MSYNNNNGTLKVKYFRANENYKKLYILNIYDICYIKIFIDLI